MQTLLVATILAADRPGIVESIASVVTEHGGNWLESRMCRLGGQFAGILRVSLPAEREVALVAALQKLNAVGINATISPDQPAAASGTPRLSVLEIVGNDRPGIVRQVSRALSGRGINVEEFTTECVSAPMSGEALFKARAVLQLPASCDLPALKVELEKIAGELMVDVNLESV